MAYDHGMCTHKRGPAQAMPPPWSASKLTDRITRWCPALVSSARYPRAAGVSSAIVQPRLSQSQRTRAYPPASSSQRVGAVKMPTNTRRSDLQPTWLWTV
jgi:hypothetical protein